MLRNERAGGHEFRERTMLDGVPSRRKHAAKGITCYWCGVYTMNQEPERGQRIAGYIAEDRLPQCPFSHADLFGGRFTERTKSIHNKWSDISSWR